MSYDVFLECPCCGSGPTDHGFNYTWNMGYAIRHGGIEMYRREDSPPHGRFVLDGAKASDALPALLACIERIEADADALREQEPKNGWGSVDTLLAGFLRPIAAACVEYPGCIVRVT